MLEKVESLIHKLFKRQKKTAENSAHSINKNTNMVFKSFEDLPKETQRRLMKNTALANVINHAKQEADRHADR